MAYCSNNHFSVSKPVLMKMKCLLQQLVNLVLLVAEPSISGC